MELIEKEIKSQNYIRLKVSVADDKDLRE